MCLQLELAPLGTPGRLWGWALQGTLGLGIEEFLTLGWALQGDSGVGGWALQGDSAAGHSRSFGLGTQGDSGLGLREGLGIPGRLWGWALQGDSGVGHSRSFWVGPFRECLGLCTPGIFWGWALQGVSRSRPGEKKSSGRGEELSLKSNNPHRRWGTKAKYRTHQTTDANGLHPLSWGIRPLWGYF